MIHPALKPGNVAVITGGADGIGKAAAMRFANLEMRLVLVDLDDDKLEALQWEFLNAGSPKVLSYQADVSDAEAMATINEQVIDSLERIDLVMNNAGIQPGSQMFGPRDNWQKIMGVNLWGVINGCQAFVPGMIARGEPGLVINTGSKQGITTPPGDPCYNVTKAGVKAYTEAMAHEFRQTAPYLSAHLLIPGFVYTGLTRRGRTEKPSGAWTPEQTVDFMFQGLEAGDFYILCPDNDVDRATDEKRIAWAAGDVIENRPALSRWHPDYEAKFAAYMKD